MSEFIRNADPHILFQSMVANVGLDKTKEIFSHYEEIVAWLEKENIKEAAPSKASAK